MSMEKMEKIDERAWGLLDTEEQTAITLQHVYGKSTWEAGEIMERAHYKYLEIKARAEKFLRIFTEYFKDMGVLVKTDTPSPAFKAYLQSVILERKTIKEAKTIVLKAHKTPFKKWDDFISKQMDILIASPDPDDVRLLHLVLDFDRWNSHRILPIKYQEPSAYKRRHKNMYKRQIKVMTELSPLIVNLIEKRHKVESRENCLYLPIVYGDYSNHRTLRILNSGPVIRKISDYGLYLYQSEEDAEEFIEVIQSYNLTSKQSCRQGQIFWPKYRIAIKKALNILLVERVIPSRANLDQVLLPLRKSDEYIQAGQKKNKG